MPLYVVRKTLVFTVEAASADEAVGSITDTSYPDDTEWEVDKANE